MRDTCALFLQEKRTMTTTTTMMTVAVHGLIIKAALFIAVCQTPSARTNGQTPEIEFGAF